MKKFLIMLLCALVLNMPLSATAGHVEGGKAVHDITVKVNGLVCDFCARALEKVFGSRSDVTDIHVDLDTHEVTIDMTDGANIDDAEVTKLITDAGYTVQEINRAG